MLDSMRRKDESRQDLLRRLLAEEKARQKKGQR